MNRVRRVHPTYYEEGYQFKCPGCKMDHILPVRYTEEQTKQRGGNRPAWTFNGSLEKPTFSPSLLVTWNWHEADSEAPDKRECCHSFIRDGRIEFLTDCTHSLAGKTVDLAEVKE